jgi:predicted GNAT superfamily acetyltransferase
MSNGLLVGFCSSSTFDASNLVWSTDGCDIFVDSIGSAKLFIDSSSVSKHVYEFFELDVLIYNPNVFG